MEGDPILLYSSVFLILSREQPLKAAFKAEHQIIYVHAEDLGYSCNHNSVSCMVENLQENLNIFSFLTKVKYKITGKFNFSWLLFLLMVMFTFT